MGKALSALPKEIEVTVNQWLSGAFDEETKSAIREIKETSPEKVVDAFYKRLEFGTGGMRGLMGPGTNRMNKYTVRAAALGLARYIKKNRIAHPSVVISYDSRLHSKEFASEAARVLAQEGITVHLFEELRPVPIVSFAVRHKKATAGIMITASHNPPEYNGFKVYWSDGSQVLPPHDKGIVSEVTQIENLDEIALAPADSPLIESLGSEIDEAYLDAISPLQSTPEVNLQKGEELKIVYTPLHGAGVTMVPKALAMWGFINQSIVQEQSVPDGTFPTVVAPNPEIASTLKLGIQQLLEQNADLLLATDADSDRVGCVVNHAGTIHILTGNEIAAICVEHLLEHAKVNDKMCVVKSMVTTELLRAITTYWKVDCLDVLTGFKYIGQKMTNWEKSGEKEFLFGCEESFGYLLGTYARDKDAVIACALLAEVALNAKLKNETLVDCLHHLYKKYGVYRSHLKSVNFEESKAGREAMEKAMKRLRDAPPAEILGSKIVRTDDFLTGQQKNLESGEVAPLDFPKSNVLIFHLEGGIKLTIRPSGTEPKIKLYVEVRDEKDSPVDLGIEHCDVLAKDFLDTVTSLLQ